MLHSHHSPGTRLANPDAPAVKREAEEHWDNRLEQSFLDVAELAPVSTGHSA
jgi:hypothetical protein